MKQYRMFEISVSGPDETHGTYVKIQDTNNGEKAMLPWDYHYNHEKDIAIDFLQSKGIEIEAYGRFNNQTILCAINFEESLR